MMNDNGCFFVFIDNLVSLHYCIDKLKTIRNVAEYLDQFDRSNDIPVIKHFEKSGIYPLTSAEERIYYAQNGSFKNKKCFSRQTIL